MERPLTGEPLAVDLVNTRWHRAGEEYDLLATLPGLVQWLAECSIDVQPDERMRSALVYTRSTLESIFDNQPGAEERLNSILARALVVDSILDGEVRHLPVFADESWRPAWQAAQDYLRLRGAGPDNIRQCEHPSCVLYFHDTTGRRRWCSMAGCGNRAKAQRHYSRLRTGIAGRA
ncbi:CGNR zinc finger domain-containing protein [Rathayibacter soli]|uniref:CGNR zinc finger domain-containing protein n=1 Tax=Rathayibacter soli TaxID=3144168 RepID=UPI0027E4B7F4|nr:CGNR zinc finger domain-containing protein [Glaciibacter superstes]